MKITLSKKSTNWKDIMAGWHEYRAEFTCKSCQKVIVEKITGAIEDIRLAYTLSPSMSLCNKCLENNDPSLGGELSPEGNTICSQDM